MTPPASLPGFQYLGGKDRRYLNTLTGETISRRQYDKLSGKLGEFSSYEKKAKASKELNPELYAARPARGRSSQLKSSLTSKGRNLKTKAGKKFKDFIIPIYYLNEEPDLARAGSDYQDFIEGLKNNPRAFAVVTQLNFIKYGEVMTRNLLPAITWPTLTQLGIALEEFKLSYDYTPEDKLVAFSLHVIFKSSYMSTL